MRLVFDLDDTLIRSTDLDAELYARAFREVFGVTLPTTDWSRYRHQTDRGIAEEAVAWIGADAVAIPALRSRFVELLSAVSSLDEVPGARALWAELRAAGIGIAIATGGWEAAARQKLRAAGIDVSATPLVGSDESAAREEILRAAVDRLGGEDPVFYVGDAAWDLRASRVVGVGFIGVGEAARNFAPRWVRDFADRGAFQKMLRGG